MILFKGPVKYLIYLFIAAWMFLLGIMVGRGSSPITFDTQKFQKRLEIIADEFGDKNVAKKKIELKFYEVLDNPVAEEGSQSREKFLEIIPKREVQERQKQESASNDNTDTIPVKTSRKKMTFKLVEKNEKPAIPKQIPVKEPGKYTIQIAAYKDFKDAVTHMSALEKKGFTTYREKGEKDGVEWYRVRTGSFASYDEAELFKEKLDKAKIKSIIMQIQ